MSVIDELRFTRNYYGNLNPPPYILTKASGERIHVLHCATKKMSIRFNSADSINFSVYMLENGIKSDSYDYIVDGQFVEVPEYGRYIISSISINSENTDYEYKECEAVSVETLIGQKYIELFYINTGTVESIDGVKFYNQQNPEKSLLHLLLEKLPDWKLDGHIDSSLMSMERSFEITRQDIYSFLTQDVASAFGCIFLFDTLNYRISVYKEDDIGTDTNVYISYKNLLKRTTISSSIDEIKTCLTVTGADNLNLREVNMGYDKIYNLDYFVSEEYMSKNTVEAYYRWKELWKEKLGVVNEDGTITPKNSYTALLSDYQNFYNQINYLTNLKMPNNPDSEDWSEYGLIPLQTKLDAYEKQLATMIKAGQGHPPKEDIPEGTPPAYGQVPETNYYEELYLPLYCKVNGTFDNDGNLIIKGVKHYLSDVELEINSLKEEQTKIGKQMDDIIAEVDMTNPNNFTQSQLIELSKFIREDELSTDNYVVTDVMTDSERMDMLNDMLEFAQKELAKVAQPQFQFNADIINLFELEEFDENSFQFKPSNYIHVILRDDYILKVRLLSIDDLDFYNPENFSVTFGNLNKSKKSNIFTDVSKALDMATSVSTTVSFNSSNWSASAKDTSTIGKMIADGLLEAGNSIKTSQSDVTIDDRGIIVSNTIESKYPYDRIFIGNSQILFSDDDFKTIRTGLGRLTYTKRGQTYNDFGMIADFLLAGYIGGTTFEGGEIISSNYKEKSEGTYIDLENGTFEFNANGQQRLVLEFITNQDNPNEVIDALLTVKGKIKADSGYIGGENGFTIEDGKIYSGKSTFNNISNGVYIGIDGIALGGQINNNYTSPFMVSSDGTLTATQGTIGGWSIDDRKIYNGLGFTNTKAGTSVGMSINANNSFWAGDGKFLVKQSGEIYAELGTIGGWSLSATDISAGVGNGKISINSNGSIISTITNEDGNTENVWSIQSNGYAYFKNIRLSDNVSISGVQQGSTFGGIEYNAAGTYGNFNNGLASTGITNNGDLSTGGFSASTGFALSGNAKSQFDTLVANKIVADIGQFNYLTTERLEADYGFLGKLEILQDGTVFCHSGFGCEGSLSATQYCDAQDFRFVTNDGRRETLSSRLVDIENRITALGG